MVRNFYVEADIDGRQTNLGGGPRSSTGEMTIHLNQRSEGDIVSDVLKITCTEREGVLLTTVYDNDGKKIFSFESKR